MTSILARHSRTSQRGSALKAPTKISPLPLSFFPAIRENGFFLAPVSHVDFESDHKLACGRFLTARSKCNVER
jgi:hypothetical protein